MVVKMMMMIESDHGWIRGVVVLWCCRSINIIGVVGVVVVDSGGGTVPYRPLSPEAPPKIQ